MSNSAELYLFYVTMVDITGKLSHTWMANSINGYIECFNSPSWNKFRYYSKEQAKSIKKLLEQVEKIKQKNGSTIKYEYKIMSLKSAVNFHIKKIKEMMEKKLPVTISEYHKTEASIQKNIEIVSKDIKEIPIYI